MTSPTNSPGSRIITRNVLLGWRGSEPAHQENHRDQGNSDQHQPGRAEIIRKARIRQCRGRWNDCLGRDCDLGEGCGYGGRSRIRRGGERGARFCDHGCIGRRDRIGHGGGLCQVLGDDRLGDTRLDSRPLLGRLRLRRQLILLVGAVPEEKIAGNTEKSQ